ncbi:MAG TPA: M23 family metallopeptidase [Thermoanaerobaculia bacterium]|jgi:hypothetical protein
MKLAAVLLFSVTITSLPAVPLIEQTKTGQALNFDLLLENSGSETLTVDQVEATVIDANGAMVLQKRLASNGNSIATLPNRELAGGKKLVIFNPFPEFEAGLDLHAIRYDVTMGKETASVTVRPRVYETKAKLILPLRGRMFVHDGHDFLSHHRRLDITGDMTTTLGIRENMGRYAYDMTIVDEQGRMYRNNGDKNEEWFGFGEAVLAPADGVVVSAAGDRPDGTKLEGAPLEFDAVMKDLHQIFGNYAILDHGHGEFSLLAHLRQGSVKLQPGQRVKRGEKIGELGSSGDSMFPHLHYQLQRDAKWGEGLPSYFSNYKRLTGKTFVNVKRGQIDTGDIVISTAQPAR